MRNELHHSPHFGRARAGTLRSTAREKDGTTKLHPQSAGPLAVVFASNALAAILNNQKSITP